MNFIALFSIVLFVAALLSARAKRSPLSVSVLFVGAGFLAGKNVFGWVELRDGDAILKHLADLALFTVLYADGMRLALPELRASWRLPGRALLAGMPLTFGLLALLGHFAAGLPWPHALLAAAVLSPTDPVFAAAIVTRDEVPASLRRLLNVESGLNDGLALPAVLGILAWLGAGRHGAAALVGDVAGGIALGVALPWGCDLARRRIEPQMPGLYGSLFIVAVGMLVYVAAQRAGLNEYLAAFAAGVTLATRAPQQVDRFHDLGEHLAQLLKFAALLAFGVMISPAAFPAIGAGGWFFTAGALLLARPAAIALSLMGSRLDWRERAAAAWFGPKGFASVVYAILVLRAGIPGGRELFDLIAVVVAVSVIAHSSTDVPMAQWLARSSRSR